MYPHMSTELQNAVQAMAWGDTYSDAIYDFKSAAARWLRIGVDDDAQYADQYNDVVW